MSDLFSNPYTDVQLDIDQDLVAPVGEPLRPLDPPMIETLIYKSEGRSGQPLEMIRTSRELLEAGSGISQPILVRNEEVGIELTLTMLNPTAPTMAITTGIRGTTKQLPKNMREAKEVLPMIGSQRTGSKSQVFSVGELKEIAKNLNLSAGGNKDVLANRIRSAVLEYFNISS